MPDNNSYEGGWGTMDGATVYWEARQDGSGKIDIFPDGMPDNKHDNSPHEHIVVDKDDNIVYWRDSCGNVTIDNE